MAPQAEARQEQGQRPAQPRRRSASSPRRRSSTSTTRTSTCCAGSCPTGPRSGPAGSPATTPSSRREIAMAIKNAREMALLPYTSRVTQQRGGRDRGDRGDRRASGPTARRRVPTAPPPTRWRAGVDVELDDEADDRRGDGDVEVRRTRADAGHPPRRRRRRRQEGRHRRRRRRLRPQLPPARGLAIKAVAGCRGPGRGHAPLARRQGRGRPRRRRGRSPRRSCPPPITITARAGAEGRLFGSVTTADIAEAIAAQTGIELDRTQAAPRRADQGTVGTHPVPGQAPRRRGVPGHRRGRRRAEPRVRPPVGRSSRHRRGRGAGRAGRPRAPSSHRSCGHVVPQARPTGCRGYLVAHNRLQAKVNQAWRRNDYDDDPTATRRPRRPAASGRVPPHNLEAEESLLGAMLLSARRHRPRQRGRSRRRRLLQAGPRPHLRRHHRRSPPGASRSTRSPWPTSCAAATCSTPSAARPP